MAHPDQRKFVGALTGPLSRYFNGARVLEVGSLDINGSVRDFFRDCDYTGLDVAPGKGVDIVCQGQDYDAPDGSFDTVISCEAMEHNPHWAQTFKNMIRVCRPGGLVVMSCATYGRREHGTTRSEPASSPLTLEWNYYRNLAAKDFSRAVDFRAFGEHRFWTNWTIYDLYFIGIKGGTIPQFGEAVSSVGRAVASMNSRRSCKYRRVVGPIFGDPWFQAMRRLCAKYNLTSGNPIYDLHQ